MALLLFAVALLGGAAPARAVAQSNADGPVPPLPGWADELTFAVGNALVGGLTAGIARAIDGESFVEGFRRGLAGGALHYAGKRLVLTTGFDGRHLLARQVAAVGTSVVTNAAAGRGALDRLFFPMGPVALELETLGGVRTLRPSVDLYDLVRIGQAAADEDLRLDWEASLLSGAVIFEGCCRVLHDRGVDGVAAGSVVLVEEAAPGMREQILEHEMVHVLQRDLINRAWFYPLERELAGRLLPGLGWLTEVRIGMLYPTMKGWFGDVQPVRSLLSPLEVEAEWIEWRR